jgi:methylenetetrahydrofolate dehydrogenase (NADP+)/methenyltetrahydrofolate cyclohydrolase
MSITLYGKPVAEAIKADIAKRAADLKDKPKLAILRAGERPDDTAYEKRVLKICDTVGITAEVHVMPADVSHADFKAELVRADSDRSVHGILVFRPLPKQIDEADICSTISP